MQASPTALEHALALYREGKVAEAEQACLELLKADQKNVAGMRLLATIARHTERPRQAAEVLAFAMHIEPTNPQLAGEMGASLVMDGRANEATDLLNAIVKSMPKSAIAHYWLGHAYLAQFFGNKAARCFRTAYELEPNNDEILRMIGVGLLAAGRGRDAEPWLRQYADNHPDSARALVDVSVSLQQQVRLDEAAALDTKALELDPDNSTAIGALGRYHRTCGRYDEAFALIRGALERLGPEPALASIFAFLCDREELAEEGIEVLKRSIEENAKTADRAIGLNFGLGRLYERTKSYDQAWESYEKANSAYAPLYDAQNAELATTDLQNTFNAWSLSVMPKATIPTDRPVFIVGMTRSGTTLTEQILSSHPECFGAGELLTLSELGLELGRRLGGGWPTAVSNITPELANEYAERYLEHINALDPNAKRIVDKLPHNYRMVGLMSVLFPGARVIHCIRNPLDLCVSNYGTPLSPRHTWRPRLDTMAHSYNEYRKIMEHWRKEATIPIFDVVYEDTIADVEKQARRIIDFVGLDWDEKCLEFHKHSRAVTTASTDQVRKPIYQTSKERWRRYEKHLGPLIEGLKAGGTNIDKPFDVEPF
jgi:tetratricopeptide (TPR) repeat protein